MSEQKEDATAPNESQLAQDGAKEEEHESELAKADCLQEEEDSQKKRLPDHFKIGTKKRFHSNDAWEYNKRQNGQSDIVYVSNKGSDTARPGERLVLRRVNKVWHAYDCELTDAGNIHRQRQAVFCCEEGITKEGWHTWIANAKASKENEGSVEVWNNNHTVHAQTRYR